MDAAKRVLTKEKLDKQLSGQTANNTPFMKMEDTINPGKKLLNKPQDAIAERLENLTSMMYKMSIQQEEGKKPFKPQVYLKRGRGQRRKTLVTETEVEIMLGKDKISDKLRMDMEMVTEEVIIDKTLVEVTAEIEAGKILGEIIIMMIGADQEREAPHLEGTLLDDIIAQVQIQGLGVDQSLG